MDRGEMAWEGQGMYGVVVGGGVGRGGVYGKEHVG